MSRVKCDECETYLRTQEVPELLFEGTPHERVVCPECFEQWHLGEISSWVQR